MLNEGIYAGHQWPTGTGSNDGTRLVTLNPPGVSSSSESDRALLNSGRAVGYGAEQFRGMRLI